VKKAITFRFDPGLIERAKNQANADNRSLTNFVETAMLRAIEGDDRKPDGDVRLTMITASSN
jgi:hypothetical protein